MRTREASRTDGVAVGLDTRAARCGGNFVHNATRKPLTYVKNSLSSELVCHDGHPSKARSGHKGSTSHTP